MSIKIGRLGELLEICHDWRINKKVDCSKSMRKIVTEYIDLNFCSERRRAYVFADKQGGKRLY